VKASSSVDRISHDTHRLQITDRRAADFKVDALVTALKCDQVALVRNATEREADEIMRDVATALGLGASLEAQAAFAGIQGHRQNVSRYFMTVNQRKEFDIVLPHSEGSGFTKIQLAAFYCHENTTDGGVSVMCNYDQESGAWKSLRELVTRIAPRGPVSATQKAIARAKFMAEEFPAPDDQVLEERKCDIAGLKLLWALVPLRRNFSSVLQREVYTYWDTVASLDMDCARECVRLLSHHDLLHEPDSGPRIDHCDPARRRARWSSGVTYDRLFKSLVIRKLEPGELIIQNNLTWAHAASNWTPGSGTRNLIAAFA
jgi:hypothetical protein